MTPAETVELPGRVMLQGGAEHDCSVRCAPTDVVELVLSVPVSPGSRLVCDLPDLGLVEATAGDTTERGCLLIVRGTPSHQARLAARIDWHLRRIAGDSDKRIADRVVPRSAEVLLRWPGGGSEAGVVIDLSATGVAVRSQDRPEPGVAVVVGRRRAVVVRHLEGGFAARFALPLRPQDVTPETIL